MHFVLEENKPTGFEHFFTEKTVENICENNLFDDDFLPQHKSFTIVQNSINS